MPAEPPVNTGHGTALVNEILEVLDKYLGTGSASPKLNRIASRTGMAVGQKKLNIEKAKEFREGLLVLKEGDDEDAIFESAQHQLITVTDELSTLPAKQQSTHLLPNLKQILATVEDKYQADYNRIKSNIALEKAEESNAKLEGLNVFNDSTSDPIKVTPDLSKTSADLSRCQLQIFIDGQNLQQILGEPLENSSVSIEQLKQKWAEGKNETQKAMIADVMPLLHQNGVLFRAGNTVLDELLKARMIGAPTRETHIALTDTGFVVTEKYTFEQLMDVTAVAHSVNIVLDDPLVYKHEFTVSRNQDGKLKAETTSLKTANAPRPDTPAPEEFSTPGQTGQTLPDDTSPERPASPVAKSGKHRP